MAAPANINIKNLQGKYVIVSFPPSLRLSPCPHCIHFQTTVFARTNNAHQNKSLSDSPDPVLALQGVGWLTRKALGASTITQHLKQSPITGEDGQPTTYIEIEQFGTGGIKGTTEKRYLNWQRHGHTDWLFGTVVGRSRYNTLKAVLEENKGKDDIEEDMKFLVEGWLKETEEGEVVENFVDNEGNKWTGWQIWGFAEINNERRLTRRFVVRRKDRDEVVRIRMTYDYMGEL